MKKTLIIFFIIFILSAGYLLIFKLPSGSKSGIAQSTSTVANVSATSSTQNLISIMPNFQRGTSPEYLTPINNTSTNTSISFKLIPTYAQNAAAGVYVNGKSIGMIGGYDISMVGFSPDNNYFAMQWIGIIGAGSKDYGVNVVDLRNDNFLNFQPKVIAPIYSSNQFRAIDLDYYIDHVDWAGSSTLNISSYYLWPDYNDTSHTTNYYRVSPEETWQYDLMTGSSILVQTIP